MRSKNAQLREMENSIIAESYAKIDEWFEFTNKKSFFFCLVSVSTTSDVERKRITAYLTKIKY